MTSLKGDQSAVRALNRRLVLNQLRQFGPLSRVKLAELTGLSSAAITGVTAELIQERFLTEQAVGESRGGRPPILLDLNYQAHQAVGLKLMEDRLEAVLTDLATRVLRRESRFLRGRSPHDVAEQAAEVTATLLAHADLSASHLVGIGMGLPGVIDANKGLCVQSPILGWRNVPIAALIADRVGVPVWVDNDVNAFAAAERLFGHGKRARSFVTVTVGRGIGAGLVLDGRIYRGRQGGAGELGHTVVEPGGRPCECGNRGCLEAYASEPSLLARFAEQHPHAAPADLPGLLALLSAEHPTAQALVADAGRRVGYALANLVNVLNPELIVLGGEGVRLGDAFVHPLRHALQESAFDGLAHDLPVVVDAWGDDAWARGAASLALQYTFDFESNRGEAMRNTS